MACLPNVTKALFPWQPTLRARTKQSGRLPMTLDMLVKVTRVEGHVMTCPFQCMLDGMLQTQLKMACLPDGLYLFN